MVILVDLNTFALDASVFLFDKNDVNNTKTIKVPYHDVTSVGAVAVKCEVEKIILQGNLDFCENYKDQLEEVFFFNFDKKQINVEIQTK